MSGQDVGKPAPNVRQAYVELKRKHQALEILTVLEGDTRTAPARLLAEWLGTIGLGVARFDFDELLNRLATEGLVRLTENGSTKIVHLTARGAEVASGIACNEWVARPLPG